MFTESTMKRTLLLAASALLFFSCDNTTTGVEDEPESEVDIRTIEDLHAPGTRTNPAANFVYFSLRDEEIVAHEDSASTNWDIAFRGTDIIINSGVSGPGEAESLMLDVPFDDVGIAPPDGYSVDSEEAYAIEGSGGWYTYTGPQGNPSHALIADEDVTIVMKTADGNHYAKLKIISYYEGNPDTSTEEFANLETRADSPYYTFQYAIQLGEGIREFN
ncbi:MAG: HmuY family protein [Balneolaceae bacterium]